MIRKVVSMFGAMAGAVVLVAACSSSGGDETPAKAGKGSDITIFSPRPGASVREPFLLKFNAGDIGPLDSGKDHVHIFVDGNAADYTVVTQNQFMIKDVPNGEHTINITKQHADHSPAGPAAEVKVNIVGGGTSGGGSTSDSGGSDGYDY